VRNCAQGAGTTLMVSDPVIARRDLSAVAQRAKAEATKQSILPLPLRGEMDCFAPRNDVVRHETTFSRRDAPEVLQVVRATRKIRGRREDRVRAAPAISCAKMHIKKTHTSIQVQRRQSGLPCAMVLRLMPRSPRRRIRLVTVIGGYGFVRPGRVDTTSADLTPATGARTTRFCRTR
jgi:hypothetical protein